MIRLVGIVLIAWALTESRALAHKLLVDCRVVGQELRIDVFYEDDSPADGAKIQLFVGESLLWTAKTDDDGRLMCVSPESGEYQIRAEHYGHVSQKSFEIKSGDMPSLETKEQHDLDGIRRYRYLIGLVVIGVGFGIYRWILVRKSSR